MITRFTSYLLSIRGYSPRTAEGYAKDCKAFASWTRAHREGARWSNISRADIDAYIEARAADGISAATTNREIAAISALYRYFIREGLLTTNPAKYESRRKQSERQPNTIDIAELRQAYEHAFGLDKYMLGVLMTTAVRVSELLAIRWEDVDWKSGAILIHGKGNKERTVYMSGETLQLFEAFADRWQRKGRIFTMDERDARYRVFQALKPYCHGKQLSPHAIRHTIATYWAKNGANVTTIAQALGHNKIATTQQYIDLAQSDTRNLMRSQSII